MLSSVSCVEVAIWRCHAWCCSASTAIGISSLNGALSLSFIQYYRCQRGLSAEDKPIGWQTYHSISAPFLSQPLSFGLYHHVLFLSHADTISLRCASGLHKERLSGSVTSSITPFLFFCSHSPFSSVCLCDSLSLFCFLSIFFFTFCKFPTQSKVFLSFCSLLLLPSQSHEPLYEIVCYGSKVVWMYICVPAAHLTMYGCLLLRWHDGTFGSQTFRIPEEARTNTHMHTQTVRGFPGSWVWECTEGSYIHLKGCCIQKRSSEHRDSLSSSEDVVHSVNCHIRGSCVLFSSHFLNFVGATALSQLTWSDIGDNLVNHLHINRAAIVNHILTGGFTEYFEVSNSRCTLL